MHECGADICQRAQNANNVLAGTKNKEEKYATKRSLRLAGPDNQRTKRGSVSLHENSFTLDQFWRRQNTGYVCQPTKANCLAATLAACVTRVTKDGYQKFIPGLQDHVLGKVNIAWVRQCRDTESCDTQESLERYVRADILCVLGTVVFPDKSTASLNSKFLPLLRDFHRISAYSWGAASLAHLYRSLCCASRYNCKEMDGPLILLFVWLGEEIIDFHPLPVYYEWYTQKYGIHLRLSDRVAGEEHPAYAQQYQDPAYAQQWPAYQQQAAYIPEPQPPQAPEPYIPQLVLRDTDFLSPLSPQEGPATSQHSGGRRATSGHASDFDFDDPTGDVDPSERDEGDLGYDLQHWYDLGGASAPRMSGSGLYDTGGASMTDFGGPDVGSGVDAGVSQGHPYNIRTQTAPPDKYTPSLYAKKAPRKFSFVPV
ncbi:hypothetical protein Ahy_A03g015024 [Arachis hypogaea]|uniref:Aminotransferase-like plant mobile domain-containing protein n=1 Tax=Arachis hypogaea TaxID=3818 RepID=A0A445DZ85_ARAHY|nr:hypothetical protein Ahy_A03g015024 [Arachis hypogaea]